MLKTLDLSFLKVFCAFLICIFFGALTHHLQASHGMAGDLTYECIPGTDSVRVRITVYRDCSGSVLNPLQILQRYSQSCNSTLQEFVVPRISITDVSPICPGQETTCDSAASVGAYPGIEEHIYETVIQLPQQCTDWKLSWWLCCRNPAITNNVINAATNMYLEATIDNTLPDCNNSPVFSTLPVIYACNNTFTSYSIAGSDPDGDSLSYHLVDPRDYDPNHPQASTYPTLASSPVGYTPGFSPAYPVETNPPGPAPLGGFFFDEELGLFEFIPDGIQSTVVAVLVNEYRNGVLIGSVMRDVQIIVVSCSNSAPQISPPQALDGDITDEPFTFDGNFTFSLCGGDTLAFFVQGFDTDSIFVNTNVDNPNGAPSNDVALLDQSVSPNTFTWTYTWPTTPADAGVYYITLSARDAGCPFSQTTSRVYRVIVRSQQIFPDTTIFVCPSLMDSVPLLASAWDPTFTGTVTWLPGGTLTDSTIHNPVAYPPVDGTADYLVILDDLAVCPIIQQVRIRPDAEVRITPDSVEICEGDTIQLGPQVTFANGTSSVFTVSWNPSATVFPPTDLDPIVFPTTTTVYTVTVSTLACDYTDQAEVVVNEVPQLNPIGDTLLCGGDSLLYTATGSGLSDATISWFPVSSVLFTDSLSTPVYPSDTTTYTITASNLCDTVSQSGTVSVVIPMDLTGGSDDVSCNGAQDGSIVVVPLDGGGNPVFTWTPPVVAGGPIAASLDTGTYVITVVDDANCRDTIERIITQPPPLLVDTLSKTDVDCFGNASGQIVALAAGGTPPYRYAINSGPFLINPAFDFLTADEYVLFVEDANGCIAMSDTIRIEQPSAPVNLSVVSVVNPNCNSAVGEISVTATGGSGNYTYCLLDPPAPPFCQLDTSFTNLLPGTYPVTVSDINGCADTVPVQIVELQDPVIDIDSIRDEICFGDSSGAVFITIQNGQPPYQLQVNGGPSITFPFSGPFSVTGLTGGCYTITLTDSNACVFDANFCIEGGDSLYANIGVLNEPSCFDTQDGSIILNGFGGTEPYIYDLNGIQRPDGFFSSLGADTYLLTLRDDKGCEVQQVIVMTAPDPLQIFPTVDSVSCPGGADGRLEIFTVGGTPDYEYSINGSLFVEENVFEQRPPGPIVVIVQDDNGCQDSANVNILEPDPLTVAPILITDVDCFGNSTGSVDVTGSGGTTPYTFSYNQGPFTSDNVLDSLPAGTYVIVMEDRNGCPTDTVVRVNQPEGLRGLVTADPVTCFGDSNGRATATIFGGIEPYTFLWSSGATGATAVNLAPGNPFVIATDANGCELIISTEILEAPEMSFDTLNATDTDCFGTANGSLLAVAQGGFPPYIYQWSNGPQDTIQTGVPAGTYIITATDTIGCNIRDTLLISEPPQILLTLLDSEPAFCGAPTGSAFVEAIGGVGELIYDWNTTPPQSGPAASELFAGEYLVTVTDSNNCTSSQPVVIDEIGEPEGEFTYSFAPLDTFLIPDEGVQFVNQSVNGEIFFWEFGDGNLSDEENPVHIYREPGTYQVDLIVYDLGFECPDTVSKTITLIPPGAIFVPNVFTPNGDGENETWSPVGVGVVSVETRIYSRWGMLITTLTNLDDRWDGTFEGAPAPEGVYVYVVNAVINDGSTFEDAGTVTLVR